MGDLKRCTLFTGFVVVVGMGVYLMGKDYLTRLEAQTGDTETSLTVESSAQDARNSLTPAAPLPGDNISGLMVYDLDSNPMYLQFHAEKPTLVLTTCAYSDSVTDDLAAFARIDDHYGNEVNCIILYTSAFYSDATDPTAAIVPRTFGERIESALLLNEIMDAEIHLLVDSSRNSGMYAFGGEHGTVTLINEYGLVCYHDDFKPAATTAAIDKHLVVEYTSQ